MKGAIACLMVGCATGFVAPAAPAAAMALSAKSKSGKHPQRPASASKSSVGSKRAPGAQGMPFLENPPYCDGSLPGDFGFDPLRLASVDWNMAELLVPAMSMASTGAISNDGVFAGSRSEGISMLYWMREAELKHGRLCMLAIVGYIAVDMGIHFPGAKYAGISALDAHNAMVTSGNMGFMLTAVFALELTTSVAVVQAAKGGDRAAGDFAWDPLFLTAKPTSKKFLQESEITHCRLAMLAFAGLVTQSALLEKGFPYV